MLGYGWLRFSMFGEEVNFGLQQQYDLVNRFVSLAEPEKYFPKLRAQMMKEYLLTWVKIAN